MPSELRRYCLERLNESRIPSYAPEAIKEPFTIAETLDLLIQTFGCCIKREKWMHNMCGLSRSAHCTALVILISLVHLTSDFCISHLVSETSNVDAFGNDNEFGFDEYDEYIIITVILTDLYFTFRYGFRTKFHWDIAQWEK